MKIVVAVKQVPERDAPPDAYALEEALQLKERLGEGEVVVLSAGPERVESTLREALAKGADRALHIVLPEGGAGSLAQRDTLGVAQMLAEAVRGESPDLVLTGLQSDDLGAGQTGVVLAELLGLPHVTLVLSVEASAGAKEIRVKRELEDGWFQQIEMPVPALLTIQSGGNRLRYATLMGIKRARSKETKQMDAVAANARHDEVVRVAMPERTRQTEMLTGAADEIAAKLVERLKAEVGI
jgi:electron transfer flavoprotein beta subunit